mmetsp:Transcript_53615/g.116876  ORF Transcript_53615/g.116876 Transcript_53615/m.116876 type:complete len:680 (-) Transcript_53615:374-2413(-)
MSEGLISSRLRSRHLYRAPEASSAWTKSGSVQKHVNETGQKRQREESATSFRFKWIGKPAEVGEQGEKFYDSVYIADERINTGDCVFVKSDNINVRWATRVVSMWQDVSGEALFEGHWLYEPEETAAGRLPGHDPREKFESVHAWENSLDVIDGVARVLNWEEYEAWLNEEQAEADTGGDEEDDDVIVCRARYNPGSGEFVPLSGASSLAEAVHLTEKRAAARTDSTRSRGGGGNGARTPSTPASASDRTGSSASPSTEHGGRRRSRFTRAAMCLTPHAAPERMPCREAEREEVTAALRSAIADGGSGTSLYLSGTPGTGKTATVHHALRVLAADESLRPFKVLEVNCMKMTAPQQVYSLLWEALSGQYAPPARASQLLDRRFTKGDGVRKKHSRDTMVLLLDELDYLVTRTQSVIYNIFEWATCAHSGIVVIGISNTMDLPERLLPRVQSRFGIMRINFLPYEHADIAAIISDRLQGLDAFDPNSIELAARKVASISGDVRRALEVCRLAAQVAEREELEAATSANENTNASTNQNTNTTAHGTKGAMAAPRHVSMSHIDEANRQLRGSVLGRSVAQLPEHQLLLLACALSLQKVRGRVDLEQHEIAERHTNLCRLYASIDTPTFEEQDEAIARLLCSRLMTPGAAPGQVRAAATAEDVRQAAKTQQRLAHILEKLPL